MMCVYAIWLACICACISNLLIPSRRISKNAILLGWPPLTRGSGVCSSGERARRLSDLLLCFALLCIALLCFALLCSPLVSGLLVSFLDILSYHMHSIAERKFVTSLPTNPLPLSLPTRYVPHYYARENARATVQIIGRWKMIINAHANVRGESYLFGSSDLSRGDLILLFALLLFLSEVCIYVKGGQMQWR